MKKMLTPSHQIPTALKAFARDFTVLALTVYLWSFAKDISAEPDYFSRAGEFVVFLVVVLFFVSQKTEFFTFVGAGNLHNMGHAAQREYLTPFEGIGLASGTLVWGFGDWLVVLIKCGQRSCSN